MPEIWPFMPKREIPETMRWNTSIERSATAEKREALMQMVSGYTYSHVLSGTELNILDGLMEGGGRHDDFLFPIWPDASRVASIDAADTVIAADTNADFRGSALLWAGCNDGSYFEATLLEARGCSLTFDAAIGSTLIDASVMPLRQGFIRSYKDSREDDRRFATVTVQFELRA